MFTITSLHEKHKNCIKKKELFLLSSGMFTFSLSWLNWKNVPVYEEDV